MKNQKKKLKFSVTEFIENKKFHVLPRFSRDVENYPEQLMISHFIYSSIFFNYTFPDGYEPSIKALKKYIYLDVGGQYIEILKRGMVQYDNVWYSYQLIQENKNTFGVLLKAFTGESLNRIGFNIYEVRKKSKKNILTQNLHNFFDEDVEDINYFFSEKEVERKEWKTLTSLVVKQKNKISIINKFKKEIIPSHWLNSLDISDISQIIDIYPKKQAILIQEYSDSPYFLLYLFEKKLKLEYDTFIARRGNYYFFEKSGKISIYDLKKENFFQEDKVLIVPTKENIFNSHLLILQTLSNHKKEGFRMTRSNKIKKIESMRNIGEGAVFIEEVNKEKRLVFLTPHLCYTLVGNFGIKSADFYFSHTQAPILKIREIFERGSMIENGDGKTQESVHHTSIYFSDKLLCFDEKLKKPEMFNLKDSFENEEIKKQYRRYDILNVEVLTTRRNVMAGDMVILVLLTKKEFYNQENCRLNKHYFIAYQKYYFNETGIELSGEEKFCIIPKKFSKNLQDFNNEDAREMLIGTEWYKNTLNLLEKKEEFTISDSIVFQTKFL